MALIKCHECGNEVSTEAKACPKCGATVRIPSQPKAPAKFSKVGWFAIGAIVIAASISQYQKNQLEAEKIQLEAKKTPEQRAAEAKVKAAEAVLAAKENRLDLARIACKEFVTKTLHDAESAEFDDVRYWAEEEKDGVFNVQVKLKAKNGFNALRKIIVDCKVQQTKDKWIALQIHERD